MKILVAYDGSECSNHAIEDLGRSGLGRDVDATVLAVADVWLGPTPPVIGVRGLETYLPDNVEEARERHRSHAQQAVREGLDLAEQAAARVRAIFPEWKVTADACAGSPAWEIVRRAEHQVCDLIFVGSHGRTKLGRLILGSVSQRVVQEAPCSVHVARPRAQDRAGVTLVLGVDGSEDADLALQAVEQRDWPRGTSVHVVSALDPIVLATFGYLLPPLVQWAHDVNDDETAGLGRLAAEACERLRARGLNAAPLVSEGRPSRLLRATARKVQADCIFVGARGLRRVERFLLGSVSSSVAARARCSVEVVRGTLVRPTGEVAPGRVSQAAR